jgi:ribosomal protein L7/L12
MEPYVQERFEALERRMAAIEEKLGVTPELGMRLADGRPPAAPSSEVLELVRAGNTLGAIKSYRAQTGAGLREAKSVVESLRGR